MKFTDQKTKQYYLQSTDIENIYISEYMPDAPGDYVKVYLYGRFSAKYGLDADENIFARHLKITVETVREAWRFWQKQGVVRLNGEDGDLTVEFVNLKEKMFGTPAKAHAEAQIPAVNDQIEDDNGGREIKELFEHIEGLVARPLTAREMHEIISWIRELGATTEVVKSAYDYCVEMGKDSINYVAKVVLQWSGDGFRTAKDVEEHLEKISERQGIYRRILNSLGLKRSITRAEKQMVDGWMDELGFSIERIMDACDKAGFAQSPNLKYVNKILESWKKEADDWGRDVNQKNNVTQGILNKYFEYLRNDAEEKAKERKKTVYEKLPELRQIDMNLQTLSSKISRGLLGGSTRQEIDNIRREIRKLEEERAIQLTEMNYPIDFTDIKYLCQKCGDTGIDENGQRCSCVRDRMGEAELWQNGRL